MDAPLKKRKLTFESELDDGGGGDDVESINERSATYPRGIPCSTSTAGSRSSQRVFGCERHRAWRACSNPAQ